MKILTCAGACFLACFTSLTMIQAQEKKSLPKPVVPTEKISLLNGKDLSDWYGWTKEYHREDPIGIFKLLPDGTLRISGEGYGGLTTKKEYADYYLVAEYRWGTETHLNRKDRSRDSGLLLHCQGPDGNYGGSKDKLGPWMASIEFQIIEGGTGDILVLRANDENGNLIESTATAEITKGPKNQSIWTPGGTPTEFKSGRINWFGRDPEWKDVIGFRGKNDVESPGQEWTKIECYAKGDTLVYLVNGVVVNRASKVYPAQGKILVQTEAAEIFFRRFDLYPLPETIP
ncbi:MAG TPA: DUF1080 domain-containing protein [Planctomicrobium sp.]|nr:DUF1080 domain-containing protein [Planctomicrobium sp.]